MNPIYKFTLSANGQSQQAYPTYKDDLAIEYALEQNQEFYRGKLSGKLTFQSEDYEFICGEAFDTQFYIIISISYDGGQNWTEYWSGQFWKTDCQFNEDDQTVIVTPTVNDRYNAVLAGMEKEYNLIDLAPVIQPIKLDKRPMIQVYVPGQTVIGCFLSGMWWEQECEAESNETKLVHDFYFALNKRQRILDITQTGTPILPDFAMGEPGYQSYYTITAGGFSFSARYDDTTDPENPFNVWEITRISDGVILFRYKSYAVEPNMPYSVTLSAVEGSGATETVTLYVHDMTVYARYVTDVETVEISGQTKTAHAIPEDDIVENNRNYNYVIGYEFPDGILFSSILVTTPTKWGIYQPGQYYFNPADNPILGIGEAFPVARSAWGRISVWFTFSLLDSMIEPYWRKEYTLKDAYPLWSVISVLLGKIAPGITHQNSIDYSQFLYFTNPITGLEQNLFITPKSNLISSGYDQPAQKAPITLKRVMDMLRDCFRCFWFIDEQNRFRIEHISWFMRGGTYPPGEPSIGIDLTSEIVFRNGKPWSYAKNQYSFDKPEMAARYQFGWMDDVTELFEGHPIDIISKYVNPDNVEQIDVSQFTSDVDYILLNPGEISKDGFILLCAELINGEYKLPYVNFHFNSADHYLQNAWVAFIYLQQFYLYDMPAWNVEIDGIRQTVLGIKKLKTQTINFPVWSEPNMFNLVKTELGNGAIQKMTINLSSRSTNTTLKYDTE